MFYGTSRHTLDDKKRIHLPARLLEHIPQADWKLTYLLAKWETEIAALTAADGKDADAVAISGITAATAG